MSFITDIVGIQVVALSDKASVPSQFALMLAKEKEEGELSEEREEIQGEDSNTLKNGNLSSNCNRPERSSSADGGKAKFNRNKVFNDITILKHLIREPFQ